MAQGINLSLNNQLSQKIVMTASMQQSISMLRMTTMELASTIGELMEENPLLEYTHDLDADAESDANTNINMDANTNADSGSDSDSNNTDNTSNTQDTTENISGKDDSIYETFDSDEWDNFISETYQPMTGIDSYGDTDFVEYESFVGHTESLYEALSKQLIISHLSPSQETIGMYIIGNLDDNGFFTLDIKKSSRYLGITVGEFEEVLNVIKEFHPVGVACASFQESIIKQMKDMEVCPDEVELATILLHDYLKELSLMRYSKIATALGIPTTFVERTAASIKKTTLAPSKGYDSVGHHIIPDIYLVPNANNDSIEITLNDNVVPSLGINRKYIKMFLDIKNNKTNTPNNIGHKKYVDEKLKEAQFLISGLTKRQDTIRRVCEVIAEHQEDFLMKRSLRLSPLRLVDIATVTGLHESTVSRATAGKFAMTAYGLLELKHFFVKGVPKPAGSEGNTLSNQAVKLVLQEIIDGENKNNPLSDQKISEKLAERGIKIARRTVTKYREDFAIPSRFDRTQ